jgi:hypothetical protein
LTPDETTVLIEWLRTNERAVALDIPDLVDWTLATGCRIDEAPRTTGTTCVPRMCRQTPHTGL